MKKRIGLLLISILSFVCVSCNPSLTDETSTKEIEYTQGLKYELTEEKDGYFVGIDVYSFTYTPIINVPSTHNNLPVIGVLSGGFTKPYGKDLSIRSELVGQYFEQINLPDTIITIESEAFSGSSTKFLKDFKFPKSLKYIKDRAFEGCESLTNIKLPDNLIYIGEDAFKECTSLESISIPEGVKSIQEDAFTNCLSLKKISIPNSLEVMYPSLFNKNIATYSKGGYYIGNKKNPYLCLVNFDENLTELTLQDGCRFFNFYPEYDKQDSKFWKLEKLNLSKTMEHFLPGFTINSLKEISGDCNIKSIRWLRKHESLTKIPTLKYCEQIYGPAFQYCYELSGKIDLSSIVDLGGSAFYFCKNITEVVLGENLTYIDTEVFYRCDNLKTIYIPKSIKYIHTDAFYGCDNIQNIYYEGSEEEWNSIKINESNLPFLNKGKITYNYNYK